MSDCASAAACAIFIEFFSGSIYCIAMYNEQMRHNLEMLYQAYNRRQYVHPDPLEHLYNYPLLQDREIVGLIASALAYGRVVQILRSISWLLDVMGESPYYFLQCNRPRDIQQTLAGFPRHRFAGPDHVTALILGIKHVIETYGSLNECFAAGDRAGAETLMPALSSFVNCLIAGGGAPGHLLAIPEKGSACKRLHLYLRWMVRTDRVDPGGWEKIGPERLMIPLDTHMHCIGIQLGLTGRQQANWKTAIEITDGFRRLVPDDPVKYDFTLTRFGIRADMDFCDLKERLQECCPEQVYDHE
ncbi:MAG: TIGR02757 family protein [Thermodesulfobacteriota bacterium]|nr:TIGR02757 family protein [Thermodesulfobacteriota bacterium]